jgi:hypothetical protein
MSRNKCYDTDVCMKRFPRLATLNVLMRSHTDCKPYVCAVCKILFSHPQRLQSHQMAQRGGRFIHVSFVVNCCHLIATGGMQTFTADFAVLCSSTADELRLHISPQIHIVVK